MQVGINEALDMTAFARYIGFWDRYGWGEVMAGETVWLTMLSLRCSMHYSKSTLVELGSQAAYRQIPGIILKVLAGSCQTAHHSLAMRGLIHRRC